MRPDGPKGTLVGGPQQRGSRHPFRRGTSQPSALCTTRAFDPAQGREGKAGLLADGSTQKTHRVLREGCLSRRSPRVSAPVKRALR
jgi:hypothetical protein